MVAEGRSEDEVAAAAPTSDLDAAWGEDADGRFVRAVYQSLDRRELMMRSTAGSGRDARGFVYGRLTAAAVWGAACFGAVAAPAPVAAQDARVDELLAEVQDTIIRLREHIHQNPELGNREFKTAELVANHLRALGFDEVYTGVAHTGVVGILRGGRPGPVVAVRADMDALPVTEDTPYPFRSTVRAIYLGQDVGVMHACGHDIHVAVQLGVGLGAGFHARRAPRDRQVHFPAGRGGAAAR